MIFFYKVGERKVSWYVTFVSALIISEESEVIPSDLVLEICIYISWYEFGFMNVESMCEAYIRFK